MNGTPRELLPIADQVLAWVARERAKNDAPLPGDPFHTSVYVSDNELRRIELCALATREAAMFFDLYGIRPHGHLDFIGGDPHGETADPQGQRSEAEGLPGAQGCR